MSTLKGQLEFLLLFEQPFAVIFVCNERSSVFMSDGRKIGFMDSHNHTIRSRSGGAVHIYANSDLDAFIYCVAQANEIPRNTNGNLCFMKFKT